MDDRRPMVEMVTSKGTIRLELFDDVAAGHVANFLKLAEEGFYDGQHFHRREPNFVVQGGCPYSRDDARHPRVGTGGPGYSIAAEFSDRPHLRGTLGMARSSDPDSAGSQFYICLAPAPFLDGKYTVFGAVLDDGMAVVDTIAVGDAIERVGRIDD